MSEPPEPSTSAPEWVKLTSGEWLKGEILGLRDQDFDFDSDKLKEVTFDWADVEAIYSPRTRTYRFEDHGVFIGTVAMNDSVIFIRTREEIRRLPRDDLLVIVEGEGSEWSFWSSKVSIGIVGRKGNTNQADLNATARIRRLTPRSRGDLTYVGNIGEIEGTRNINNHNVRFNVDALLISGLFVTLASVNLLQDEFQNIDLRTTVGAGLGYHLYQRRAFEFRVTLEGAYQNTGFVSVQEGESDRQATGAILSGTALEVEITKDVELTLSYNAQVAVPDVKNAFHYVTSVVAIDVWGDVLSLDLSVNYDRTETPTRDAEGNLPERDDFRTSLGLGLKF